MALKEFKSTRQDDSGLVKRWFNSLDLDVFIWSDKTKDIVRIEVLWPEDGRQLMWVWQFGQEAKYFEVNEADSDPRKNLSQTYQNEVDYDYSKLLFRIETSSGELPLDALTIFRMLV